MWPGVLIECDPSVKAIILKYDEERHDYIVEDLDDDRHLVIKESQLQNLKIRLGKVRDQGERRVGFIADQDCRTWTTNLCSPTNRNPNNRDKTPRHFHSRRNITHPHPHPYCWLRFPESVAMILSTGNYRSRKMRKHLSLSRHRATIAIHLGPVLCRILDCTGWLYQIGKHWFGGSMVSLHRAGRTSIKQLLALSIIRRLDCFSISNFLWALVDLWMLFGNIRNSP